MREERQRGHHRGGGGPKRKDRKREDYKQGAKTFRRGRAIAFLDILETKRATLQKQLQEPELQSINPVIAGELKAIEMVISEYVQLFELHEAEEMETDEHPKAAAPDPDEKDVN
ncbi:MAG: hypothetical protein ACI4XS_01680 [Bacillus sp. (in: firmicutes)]